MKTEDSYFIADRMVRVSRKGAGIVSDHVDITCPQYYGGISMEVRYVIMDHSGVAFLPSNIYNDLISDYPAASSHLEPTNNYKREIDRTYFKYYDDAEEVLNNIISFILWIKKSMTGMKERDEKKVMNLCGHLINNVTQRQSIEGMMKSPLGFPVKKRSVLSGLEAFVAKDQDLLEGRSIK